MTDPWTEISLPGYHESVLRLAEPACLHDGKQGSNFAMEIRARPYDGPSPTGLHAPKVQPSLDSQLTTAAA